MNDQSHDVFPRHLADAYQPEAMSAGARARLKMAVRARTAERAPSRNWRERPPVLAAMATAVAVSALVFVTNVRPTASDPGWAASELETTWEEDVLYGNEWVGERADWLDADLVPASYDGAFLALEP